jgi:hypothetical protein
VEECGPCPVFASFTLAFALKLRKKHGKNISQVKKNLSEYSTRITTTLTRYKTYAHTRPHIIKSTPTHIHTLQNNYQAMERAIISHSKINRKKTLYLSIFNCPMNGFYLLKSKLVASNETDKFSCD